jgi:hypothetical protein
VDIFARRITCPSPKKTRIRLSIIGVGILAIFLAGWNWPWGHSYDAPEKTTTAVAIPTQPSSIILPIVAPLAEIQARLEQETPGELFTVDENRDACVPAKWAKVCILPKPFGGCAKWLKTKISPDIDCHLEGWVRRGPIAIGGSGQDLTLDMPVSLSVTARGRGDIGKNIHETATGAANIHASASVDIDENWKPSASVSADYHWTDRIGVDILGFRITFASKVDPQIRKAIDSFQSSLPATLDALKLKETVATAWPKGFATIEAHKDPDVWVRFTPSSIGYGGYNIADGDLRTSLLLIGNVDTFVGKKPADAVPTPLPPLIRGLPDPGFHLNLPVMLEFQAMQATARKQLNIGTPRDLQVPGFGAVAVTIKDIEFHQTKGQALAIGVTLNADPEGSWFDTRGTVWLTAKPSIDNQAKKVTANDLQIYGNTDNAAADLLISIVQFGPIKQAIQAAATFDYSKPYDDGLAKLNAAMRKQISPDVYFDGNVDSASVESIVAGPDALHLWLGVTGKGEIHLGTLPAL